MLDILKAIVEAKKKIENNIEHLGSKEIEELKLYEQIAALEKAEDATRSVVRIELENTKREVK